MDSAEEITMHEVAVGILEDAAFVFSEPREAAWPDESREVWEAEIEVVRGARHGKLALASSPTFAAVLASNLLGIEPEDIKSEQSSEDALRELLNMICGAMLERWGADEGSCSMGTPRLRKTTAAEHRETCRDARPLVRLLAEDHCVDLAFFGSPSASPARSTT